MAIKTNIQWCDSTIRAVSILVFTHSVILV